MVFTGRCPRKDVEAPGFRLETGRRGVEVGEGEQLKEQLQLFEGLARRCGERQTELLVRVRV